jgi:hypothetical protein
MASGLPVKGSRIPNRNTAYVMMVDASLFEYNYTDKMGLDAIRVDTLITTYQ